MAQASCSMSSSTVEVGSTVRRKRNHDVNGTRRVLSAGMSPISSTTMPKPPLCSSRSVTFNTCSRRRRALPCGRALRPKSGVTSGSRSLQRIHSRRSSTTPAALADAGSKLSPASTSAHTSWRCVAAARAEIIMPVRPEETGPVISLSAPRGRPPVSASSSAMPMGTVCGAMRSRSNSVGTSRSLSDDSILARSVAADGMKYLGSGKRVSGVRCQIGREST